MPEEIDARGLSCPQPVLLTRRALQAMDAGELTVLIDTMTQVHNCSRAAEKLGWQASFEEQSDVFKLTLRK